MHRLLTGIRDRTIEVRKPLRPLVLDHESRFDQSAAVRLVTYPCAEMIPRIRRESLWRAAVLVHPKGVSKDLQLGWGHFCTSSRSNVTVKTSRCFESE